MPRFFVPRDAVAGGRASITGADAGHLARSLRARAGEEVVVVDDDAVEHGVRLDEVSAERCAGEIVWSRPSAAEPRLAVTVLQSIAQQGMEEAVAAMVQVGVHDIVPVVTVRGVVRLDRERAARRAERWRAVAREAAGLAGRGLVPRVGDVVPLATALAAVDRDGTLLAATPRGAEPLAALRLDPALPVTLAIGPEGGFDNAELALLGAARAREVHLGPRILPARLAGAVAAALLLGGAGDLGGQTVHKNHA